MPEPAAGFFAQPIVCSWSTWVAWLNTSGFVACRPDGRGQGLLIGSDQSCAVRGGWRIPAKYV